MTRGLKDTLYVPLSIDVLEDPDLNECSMAAQCVYFRGLAHAKRAALDGLVWRRAIMGGLYGARLSCGIEQGDAVAAGIEELVNAGLWVELPDRDGWRITGWLKHNEPVEGIENRRAVEKAARTANAHRSNHLRGLHEGSPRSGCPECELSQVGTLGTAERTANGSAERYDPENRSAGATETETETETETDTHTHTPPGRLRLPVRAGPFASAEIRYVPGRRQPPALPPGCWLTRPGPGSQTAWMDRSRHPSDRRSGVARR